MSRYDDLISNICTKPILCSNLGFGEQGAILSRLKSGIFLCNDLEKCRCMQTQLSALNKKSIIIDQFDRPFTISKFQNKDSKFQILSMLKTILANDSIIISTPPLIFSILPDIENFKSNIISIDQSKEYDIIELEKLLSKIGYNKVDIITSKGEFSRRGDVLDIFDISSKNPIRINFFDTTIEDIVEFDLLTFEKLNKLNSIKIIPSKINLFNEFEKENIINELKKSTNENPLFFDLISDLENNQDIPNEFLIPFIHNISTINELNIPIIISSFMQFEIMYNKYFDNINEKINLTFNNEKIKKLYKNSKNILKINDFFEKFNKKLIFFENFDLDSVNLKNKINTKNCLEINFNTKNFSSYKNNLQKLKEELSTISDKQIYLCLDNTDTLNSIKKIFTETNLNFSTNKNAKGIILTELKIPYNICFEDEDKYYIGSTNFAHKQEIKSQKSKPIKYLPKAGEYVVHSIHGVGKCEGLINMTVGGVDKEFFKIIYKGGDSLYVPYEQADSLSLYLSENDKVTLNKLGGKEFTMQKLRAQKSIEDMSEELLELYAKRKMSKGFKYPEDDYLYTEFENAFSHIETNDQLHAIADIKRDMISGRVMDRLICGDVGFGKTEVAMRAMFKAVQAGKQVAILAPTTILSMQHFMTASERTKDFGVRIEMLNRFKSSKEQKQILSDLKEGKIDVICGTHRLLSEDVKFNDLGLLILDEEQRFGVKAKEHIKTLKNNINVLTLSATPIPRTLSMSLMQIRDISVINTPPVERKAVKTYVLAYNQELILNAIKEELNRDGQTLIVFNNIEQIYTLASTLEKKLNDKRAKFDVAHGQMSEVALENAIKRLYNKETNVFVSTTLIENGVDLPSANTLIVVESDRLGLSQMYQLRGRVGRSNEQAFAYFTYNKDKTLTEDATNRLQAIAENTELGSGFKIAMRDLQIRGAGELLGKVQHGHMIKIGYDMYAKLLNDTLKKLKGEKVETYRDVKLDIAINSIIPRSFLTDETERLKVIAKLSNIASRDDIRTILGELIGEYGKLPKEIYHLANVSLMKSLAEKHNIKQIIINKANMSILYYPDIDVDKLIKKVNKFSLFHFVKSTTPTISLNTDDFTVQSAMNYMIEFLLA